MNYFIKFFLIALFFNPIFMFLNADEKFSIIIPSFNNEKYCRWNLTSALNQNHANYKIIYINDASSDRTQEIVEELKKTHPKGHLITLVNNTKNCGALENIYHAVYDHTDDNDVILLLDGDDALSSPYVLKKLEEVYSRRPIWLTFGQFRERNSGSMGFVRKIPYSRLKQQKLRSFPHGASHLKTFKSWLFKQIKKEDLLYQGNFYAMSWDLAIMFPMLEMAAEHHYQFVDQVLYIYNDANPISDHQKSKELQRKLDLEIRSKKPYSPINGIHRP
ncbi:MAG: glycosyltransferase [Simkaniaceae bacterium]|nr:glycosyltransferase [Simkaniaceae bacterium]